jgi:FdhD protein
MAPAESPKPGAKPPAKASSKSKEELAVVELPSRRLRGDDTRDEPDRLAAEAALEIRFDGKPFTVLMRTPGHDEELVLGFLFSEGIVASREEVVAMRRPESLLEDDCDNVLDVSLARAGAAPIAERTFYASASCGACGKSSRAELEVKAPRVESNLAVDRALLERLPERLRERQPAFAATGGIHASALVAADGTFLAVREDVGRHNAVDKLVGWALDQGRLPLSDLILFVSGRLGFEIVQKAIVAGIPILGSVGAASSLAVALAMNFGLTLATFVRPGAMNLFGDLRRVTLGVEAVAPAGARR